MSNQITINLVSNRSTRKSTNLSIFQWCNKQNNQSINQPKSQPTDQNFIDRINPSTNLKVFRKNNLKKFTFVVTNPEKCQLIHPPTTIMGTILVMFPFTISVIMLGSVIGFGGAVVFRVPTFIQSINFFGLSKIHWKIKNQLLKLIKPQCKDGNAGFTMVSFLY